MNDISQILVTHTGECFSVQSQGKDRADNRDGVLHYFHLTDMIRGRGLLRVAVYRGGPRDLYMSSIPEFERRIDGVLLNRIRRAFDYGELTFDTGQGETYKEIKLEPSDFEPQAPASDLEIRQLIMHSAYWLSYRLGAQYSRRHIVQFDSDGDLEYLGVGTHEIRRNQWLLEEDGLLEKSNLPGSSIPTASLVKTYENKQHAVFAAEEVYPPGTQYKAFKAIKQILLSATSDILIADNYLDDSILDMLEALVARPSVRLLTSKASKDFKVAINKFRQQYGQAVDVKLHQKQIHDRAIVIDDKKFYALGASIKDLGNKLSLINEVQEPQNISRLRSEFQAIWASAQPI